MSNTITRRGSFDAGHRILFQRFKCGNLHGHRYEYELEFRYESMLALGYAIDFSEIKRVACEWIDENFDHGFIVNPADEEVLGLLRAQKSRHFVMHLRDEKGSCNPTAENIAKELFFAASFLQDSRSLNDSAQLKLVRVKLHETQNCIVTCEGLSPEEHEVFRSARDYCQSLESYRNAKGTLEYDARQVPECET